MHIQKLQLYNFRNFSEQKINFSPGINLIVGRNGQGKTNLVEAISFISQAKSFRSSKVEELLSWGQTTASVFAHVKEKISDFEIGITLEKRKKTAFLNGDKISSIADYLGRLLCVSFSPTDLELVKGAPSERRSFMDRHLTELEPKLLPTFFAYSKALRSKSKLLKSGSASSALLESWNQILATNAALIIAGRMKFVALLSERASAMYAEFASEDGEIGLRLKNEGKALSAEQEIFNELQRCAEREIHAASCLVGPHRDDLLITFNGHDARSFASQGQARSLVLALKLAVIQLLEEKRGESPVLLLDDVDSELDSVRSTRLFRAITATSRQVFVTSTNPLLREIIGISECLTLAVQGGQISALSG